MKIYQTDFLFFFLGLFSNTALLIFLKNNFILDSLSVSIIGLVLCIIDGFLLNWAKNVREKIG